MVEENNKETEQLRVTLASLFHDIGKFKFRCKYSENPDQTEKIGHEDMLQSITGDTILQDLGVNDLLRKTTESFSRQVWMGDFLSAGERDLTFDEEGELKKNKDVLRTPLIDIFSRLNIEKDVDDRFVKFRPLESNKSIGDIENFYYKREENPKEDVVFIEDYYNKFKNDDLDNITKEFRKIENLKNDTYAQYKLVLRIEDLLKNYLETMPSSAYVDTPDISLFQHSKLSSAISTIIHRVEREKEDMERSTEQTYKDIVEAFRNGQTYESKDNSVLFIKGDFSGIQDFISTICSDKALKMLKARSTYLNLLNKLLPHYIAKKLGYSSLNIIYSSGGTFQILADNSEDNKNKLKEIEKELNDFFFERLDLKLFVSISFNEMKLSDIHKDHYKEKVKTFFEESSESNPKNKKFFEQIKERGYVIEEGGGGEDSYETCDTCKKEFQPENDELNCKECENLIKFGKKLNKIQNENRFKIQDIENLLPSNMYEELAKIFEEGIVFNDFSNRDKHSEILSLGLPLDENGKTIPFFKDEQDFDESVESDKTIISDSDEFRKLGGLKLDVDNLGSIFSSSLGDKITISRYTQLSHSVGLFFEYFVDLLRNEEEFREKIYTIYSGGDDCFFIGEWKSILKFSKRLVEYFNEYVGREDITLSMAINFFSPKYPVKSMFESLEEELDNAKSISGENSDKGRFSLLNRTMKIGSEEYEEFHKLRNELGKLVRSEQLRRSAIQVVIDTILNIERQLKKNDEIFIPNLWNIDYYFTRNYDREKNPGVFKVYDKVIENLKEFCTNMINSEGKKELMSERINFILLALKLAQYETKDYNQEVKNEPTSRSESRES